MIDWSLIVCGDWSPSDGLARAIRETPSSVYGNLLPIMQDTDLLVVNLEGVFTDED